ncbi:uncharacterized protein N7459_008793 [Penicillium hispanicum]|uniref:uncharacterized protein n=1 Tax=Penicillium hispanicum TaxID=1080232 RepID=UPI00254142A3|nr:uncharacterized protein N7459_008793 [Penicillium hispanicum]KAJ5574366.1 hypothetical protein N7459_008793 [Penicillium hispanicum]
MGGINTSFQLPVHNDAFLYPPTPQIHHNQTQTSPAISPLRSSPTSTYLPAVSFREVHFVVHIACVRPKKLILPVQEAASCLCSPELRLSPPTSSLSCERRRNLPFSRSSPSTSPATYQYPSNSDRSLNHGASLGIESPSPASPPPASRTPNIPGVELLLKSPRKPLQGVGQL